MLVPGGDSPARRRARQRRRDGPEGRGDLHVACVVVLSEEADVAIGCGRSGRGVSMKVIASAKADRRRTRGSEQQRLRDLIDEVEARDRPGTRAVGKAAQSSA